MRDHLRAGVAIYNVGEHHAAHDAWKDHWLGLESERATSQFVTFVMDFASDRANRGIIFQRLSQHVEKRTHREEDVDGLFE